MCQFVLAVWVYPQAGDQAEWMICDPRDGHDDLITRVAVSDLLGCIAIICRLRPFQVALIAECLMQLEACKLVVARSSKVRATMQQRLWRSAELIAGSVLRVFLPTGGLPSDVVAVIQK